MLICIRISLFVGILMVVGCSSPEQKARRIERKMMEHLPVLFADEVLPVVFNAARLDSASTACAAFRQKLDQVRGRSTHSDEHSALERAERFLDKHEALLRSLSDDPSLYNIGGYLKTTLALRGSPLKQRLEIIRTQLERATPYYASAKKNLSRPDPSLTRLAVQKQLLTLEFLQTELIDSVAMAEISPSEKKALYEHIGNTHIEVKDYLAFCQSLLFEHKDSTIVKELFIKR